MEITLDNFGPRISKVPSHQVLEDGHKSFYIYIKDAAVVDLGTCPVHEASILDLLEAPGVAYLNSNQDFPEAVRHEAKCYARFLDQQPYRRAEGIMWKVWNKALPEYPFTNPVGNAGSALFENPFDIDVVSTEDGTSYVVARHHLKATASAAGVAIMEKFWKHDADYDYIQSAYDEWWDKVLHTEGFTNWTPEFEEELYKSPEYHRIITEVR